MKASWNIDTKGKRMKSNLIQMGLLYSMVSTSVALIVLAAIWVDWEIGRSTCLALDLNISACRGVSVCLALVLAFVSGVVSFMELKKDKGK